MQSTDRLTIDLRQAAQSATPLTFSLDDAFFQDLDQQEIAGGHVCLTLSVKAPTQGSPSEVYQLTAKLQGTVTVLCDRCLDPLELPVSTGETYRVGYEADEPQTDDSLSDTDIDDTLYTATPEGLYCASWDIYSLIELSLPTQRLHPEGACDPDMLERIAHTPEAL